MWAEQAIFTSLARGAMSGYHVVSRSPGVSEAEAAALATWCPSHGALIIDEANGKSVNFHPLVGDRFALSRTCEGGIEYSGRGQRQVYTHALILDLATLRRSDFQPLSIYYDAMALGVFVYRGDPDAALAPVELSDYHPPRDLSALSEAYRTFGLPPLSTLRADVDASQSIRIVHPGDRVALAECLMGLLGPEMVPRVSFSTSLRYSTVRPFRLTLLDSDV